MRTVTLRIHIFQLQLAVSITFPLSSEGRIRRFLGFLGSDKHIPLYHAVSLNKDQKGIIRYSMGDSFSG
ncbi:MAG: hypothetical protein WC124_05060 [Desulfoplanes sp.]